MIKQEKLTDLGALRSFVAIAQSETITQAADKLGLTQSAVSQSLKQLESQLCVELVVRRARPLALTAAGRVLLEHANELLAANQRLLSAVQMASEGQLDTLYIGMIDSFADAAGQQLLDQLIGHAQNLSLRTGLMAPLHDALLEREIDLLVTSDQLLEHPELNMQVLLRDPFVLLVADRHLQQLGDQLTDIVSALPNISFNRTLRLGALTRLIGRRLGINYSVRFELDSTTSLLRFVQAGHGWAFAPTTCLLSHPELLEGVSILPIAPGNHARFIYLFNRPGELGELPTQIAALCREIYQQQLETQLPTQAQWLRREAHSLEALP